jgi:predicted HicB family RNase H-like nuclease
MAKDKKDTKIDLRIPSALARSAKAKAKQQKRSLADVIRELLRAWLGQ